MRFTVTLVLVAAMFLTSCAYEGVIVEKRSRPHPLYHSVGIEGVYTFVLRDSAGALHRQMVTPDVFEQYAEGDYFNDLQPAASRAGDYKATRTVSVSQPKAPARTAAAVKPKKPTRNTATTRPRNTAKASKVAAKSGAKPKAPKPQNKQTAWTSRTAAAKRTSSPMASSSSRQAKRSTQKPVAAKRVAKKSSNANGRPVARKPSKPSWKMTEPTVETAPTPVNPQPPAEGPVPAADATPAPEAPAAAKPTAEESDIVYIPPPPR